ncbi:MAG: tRNA (adenosine(37)-N6)-threonylcarbamoyltransferase complex transferase subunit TsaD [Pirellulales bacterium]
MNRVGAPNCDTTVVRILTLETTCDETAAAVVTDRLEVLGSVVASQDALHERFGGVVPEIASRAHVERMVPVLDEVLRRARITFEDLDAVGVAYTPGLAGSLLVGLVAAKTISMALRIPLIAIDHLQAHVYACRIASGEEIFPCVGLIVSGGHSNLYRCDGPCDFTLLGATVDDAAGEAFDKVASMLGLPYPGGPAVGKAAESGRADAICFPRPFLRDRERFDFSFSGLKTAVRYHLTGGPSGDLADVRLTPGQVADVAASFQQAVVDCLVAKAELALERTGLDVLCVGGGVAANTRLRESLATSSRRHGYRYYVPPPRLCTDNAVMGAIAVERYRAGKFESLDLDTRPGLVRRS